MAEIEQKQSLVLRERIIPKPKERPDFTDSVTRIIQPLKQLELVTPANEANLRAAVARESESLLALGIPGDLYIQLALGRNSLTLVQMCSRVDENTIGISPLSPVCSKNATAESAELDPYYGEGWFAQLRLATQEEDGSDIYYAGHRFDNGVGSGADPTQRSLLMLDKTSFEREHPGYNMSDVAASGHCVRFLGRLLAGEDEYLEHGAVRVASLGRVATYGHGFRYNKTDEVVTYIKHEGGQLWVGHDKGKASRKTGISRSIGRNNSEF